MPAGITAMLPVVHHPTDHILQHVDETAASSNMAVAPSSFAWGGEHAPRGEDAIVHKANPYLPGNHYVQPSAFAGGTDHNKYAIEKEGPGFRNAIKNEVERIMYGPEGPYAKRSVETASGTKAPPKIDFRYDLAPQVKLDQNVQNYFALMKKLFDQSRNIPHFDNDGHPIKPPLIPDPDQPPPHMDDTPTITQPPLLEEDKSWVQKLGEFFEHSPSSEKLAQRRAENLFGSAMHGSAAPTPAPEPAVMSDEQANRIFGGNAPPKPPGDPRDNEVGYVNSLMRMFGGAHTGETQPTQPPQPVPGVMVKQNEVPVPPALHVFVDESISYFEQLKQGISGSIDAAKDALKSRSCGCSLSTILSPSRGHNKPPSSMQEQALLQQQRDQIM